MKKLILFALLIFNTNSFSESVKDSPFEWNLDLGLETGEYQIPLTDDGDYGGLFVGTRLGFNLGSLFLGGYAKLTTSSFDSKRAAGSVDRSVSPLPDKNATLWGPTLAYKFTWVHLYYSYLFESHKFDSDVDTNGTRTNLVYRYEGNGHEFGLGLRIYGDIFLTYNFRLSELGDFKQKVNGTYTNVEPRDNPLRVKTHVFALRVPINLTKLPGFIRSSLSGN